MAMDRPRLEIGIDSQDPFRLAPFWVAALGYEGTRGDAAPYLDLIAPEGATGSFCSKCRSRNRPRTDYIWISLRMSRRR